MKQLTCSLNFLSWFIAIALTCGFSQADQKTCGVEAAFGAVHALGLTPNLVFTDLLTVEYMSQIGGSTASDVCRAVEKLGGEAA